MTSQPKLTVPVPILCGVVESATPSLRAEVTENPLPQATLGDFGSAAARERTG